MTSDLRAHLDRLDTALAAATQGPWRQGELPYVYAEVHDGMPVVADCYANGDAAAIVAAVNALPGLLAAVRAAADLADRHERSAKHRRALADRYMEAERFQLADALRRLARQSETEGTRLRTALAAALTAGDAP